MKGPVVGVIGATSLVGDHLLQQLVASGRPVVAFSRGDVSGREGAIEWRRLPQPGEAGATGDGIADWIVVAPVWVIPEHLVLLQSAGARRIVALSSTSVFVKHDSSDAREQAVAAQLSHGEAALTDWCDRAGVQWILLRPTLIYGEGRDQNIAAAARFIRRFGFFPLIGSAQGRRQPVRAADVAAACMAALDARNVSGRAYNISGGEVLAYSDMIAAVFMAMGRRPRMLRVPAPAVRLGVRLLRLLPGFRHITAAMADRMAQDLVFDHADAVRDLGYEPQPFRLREKDVLPCPG